LKVARVLRTRQLPKGAFIIGFVAGFDAADAEIDLRLLRK
jgi:uncharacterized membrane protein